MQRRNTYVKRKKILHAHAQPDSNDHAPSRCRQDFAINQTRKPCANVARLVKMTSHALRATADRKRNPAKLGHGCKNRFVGDIVTDKNWTPPAERRAAHQFAYTACLVET